MADRKYDDKEVGEILKAAAEMQSGTATSDGMTLNELKRVAEEIGIKSDLIGQAAIELDSSPKGKSKNKSDALLVEQSIQGELTVESWEDLVNEMRRNTGQPGKIEIRGDSREWIGSSDVGSMMLSATSRRGRTRIKILGDTSGTTALAIVFGLVFGILLSMAPVVVQAKTHALGAPFTALLSLLVIFLCYVGSVSATRHNRNRFSKRMESILSKICAIAETNEQAENPLVSRLQQTPDVIGVPKNNTAGLNERNTTT